MPAILKKPRVKDDFLYYFDLIAADKIAPAERFLEVAEESFERLASHPQLGRKWQSRNTRLVGLRLYPMPSPYRSYLIFYRPTADGIEVLAILHGAQNLERTAQSLE